MIIPFVSHVTWGRFSCDFSCGQTRCNFLQCFTIQYDYFTGAFPWVPDGTGNPSESAPFAITVSPAPPGDYVLSNHIPIAGRR